MTNPRTPAKSPCGSCPYRTDVPSGIWHPDEYAKLPAYDEDTPYQPHGVFMCHQVDGRICAGWAGCHDMNHSLALRMATGTGQMTYDELEAVLDYVSPVELFPTGQAAADHGLADVEHPTAAADRMAAKIETRRERLR